MRFNHLHVPDQWEHYWTRYPEGFTVLEALITWVKQVDDMVDNQNALTTTVENYGKRLDQFLKEFDEDIRGTVENILTDWQESGFLNIVITDAIQWELDTYKETNDAALVEINRKLDNIFKIDVRTFGAKGDKVTDDTQAIKNAIAEAESLVNNRLFDGVDVYFPKGSYLISSTLIVKNSGVRLVAQNTKTAFLYAVQPDFDMVYFDGRELSLYHVGFNLGIIAENGASAGVALKMHRVIDSEFDVYLNGIYDGVELDGVARTYFNTFTVKQETRTTGKSRYFLDLKGNYGINSDLHFPDINFHQIKNRDNAFNLSIRCVDGLYVGSCHINGGLIFQPSNGNFEKTIASVFFDILYLDGSAAENIIFTGACDNYRNFKFGKIQCRDGATGFVFATTGVIDFIQIDSLLIYDIVGNGFESRTDNHQALQIGNLMVKNANTGQQTTKHYALIGGENTQISNLILIGETATGSGLNVRSSAKNTQLGKVNMNRFTRTTQSVLPVSFLGVNTTVESMIGIVNFVQGDIVIPPSGSKVTVTHTLGVPYNVRDIFISPRAYGDYRITNKTDTTFDVELKNPADDYGFYAGYQIYKRRFN